MKLNLEHSKKIFAKSGQKCQNSMCLPTKGTACFLTALLSPKYTAILPRQSLFVSIAFKTL